LKPLQNPMCAAKNGNLEPLKKAATYDLPMTV
jgi:hypothetical protein